MKKQRIVKEADERREEILQAATVLFTTKGYDKTTINDILKEVNIAKGTFYYYFKSKEEVVDAIIEQIVEKDVMLAKGIAQDPTLNPIQKIITMFIRQQPQEGDVKKQIIEEFHEPNNSYMHQKSITQTIIAIAPILSEIIQEGTAQGIFYTNYPQEVIEQLLAAALVLFEPSFFEWTQEESVKKIVALIDSMERLLGAETGSFLQMSQVLSK